MAAAMIVSVFTACGKTWVAKQQETLGYSVLDAVSTDFEGTLGWEREYVDWIISCRNNYDFIFINQQRGVLKELNRRRVPFVIVAPDNSQWLSDRERHLTKEQLFGRIVLRDLPYREDLLVWLETLDEHYKEWTSWEHLDKSNPVAIFRLQRDQYLSDIMSDLDFKRIHYAEYTVAEDFKESEALPSNAFECLRQ